MRTMLLILVVVSSVAVAAPPDLVPPPPEVVKTDVKIDLPAVPSFELPAGPLTVKRLRVAGRPLLGQRVVLRGVITYAYDCVKQIRKPGETDRAVRARIDADPTLCERPKFYIADDKATPRYDSLWVVDVPRPYNKLELKNIAKADRSAPDRCEPGEKDPAKQICPPYQVGDEVIVDGTFTTTSPHSERDSDGLLVYSAMKNVTRKWTTPGAKLDATMVATSGAPAAPAVKSAAVTHVPPGTPDPTRYRESIQHANEGNRALAQRQLDAARTAYRAATDAWDGNHVAWYGLGAAHAFAQKWPDASDAFEHAVARAPGVAMYRLWYGIALYEQRLADEAAAQLAEAVRLVPELWRAHYYLGRIAREADRPHDAAEQFALAIRGNPHQAAPYLALGELLRRWDYTDQAIQVLSQATMTAATSDTWFALGMGYFDKQLLDQAIDAYTKALGLDAANHKARFQRGVAYFRRGDVVHAKADLEDFVKADSKLGFEQAVAGEILGEIAAKANK
ncbi:MAG: tetratricopeptide repeat protein [Acidobacteriota bacterium]